MADTSTDRMRGTLAERAASTEVERAGGDQPATIADLINRQRSEIARALPKHMDADRLARIATTVIKTTPTLMQCSAPSLLGSLMLSAQTGMEPGPLGHAYFVPRKNKGQWECQWMLGYKGIVELARRSGQLISIEAREVCERDRFEYAYGLDEKLVHEPYMDGERGPIVAFWGLARFKDGGHYFLVMSKSDVDKAKERSDAAKAGFGPWISDYAAMGRKTVIRRMAPFLPLSPEQANVLAFDETVNTRVAPGLTDEPPEAGWANTWGEPEQQAIPATSSEVQPEPAADADADDDAEQMSDHQRRHLHALLRAKFGATGDARFPVLTQMLGREITSTNELNPAEADDVIARMQPMDDHVPPGSGDPCTADQRKALDRLLKSKMETEGDERWPMLTSLLLHTVESYDDVTEAEAAVAIVDLTAQRS